MRSCRPAPRADAIAHLQRRRRDLDLDDLAQHSPAAGPRPRHCRSRATSRPDRARSMLACNRSNILIAGPSATIVEAKFAFEASDVSMNSGITSRRCDRPQLGLQHGDEAGRRRAGGRESRIPARPVRRGSCPARTAESSSRAGPTRLLDAVASASPATNCWTPLRLTPRCLRISAMAD